MIISVAPDKESYFNYVNTLLAMDKITNEPNLCAHMIT